MLWRSIKSAPRDGTPILGLYAVGDRRRWWVEIVSWLEHPYKGPGWFPVVPHMLMRPTHWMPFEEPGDMVPQPDKLTGA